MEGISGVHGVAPAGISGFPNPTVRTLDIKRVRDQADTYMEVNWTTGMKRQSLKSLQKFSILQLADL